MRKIIQKILKSSTCVDIFSQKGITTFVNPFAYTYIRKDSKIFNYFDFIFVDGMLLTIFINTFYKSSIKRLSFDMTSLAPKLFSYAEKNNKEIYFIGDSEKAITNSVQIIQKNYPNLKIVGYRNGFFRDEFCKNEFIEYLYKINPDFIVVGMGLYKQEEFLLNLKNKGWKGLGFTCGGFFHQITDTINYYPNIINTLNLRWIYRFIKEPNVRWRLLRIIFLFPFQFLYDYCSHKN